MIYLAEAADKSGFDSLWVLERLLWPITPQTKHPSTPTGNFPQDWQNVLEPLELLSFVAAVLKNISWHFSHRHAFPQSSHIGKEICYVRCYILGRALAGLDWDGLRTSFWLRMFPLSIEAGEQMNIFAYLNQSGRMNL